MPMMNERTTEMNNESSYATFENGRSDAMSDLSEGWVSKGCFTRSYLDSWLRATVDASDAYVEGYFSVYFS